MSRWRADAFASKHMFLLSAISTSIFLISFRRPVKPAETSLTPEEFQEGEKTRLICKISYRRISL